MKRFTTILSIILMAATSFAQSHFEIPWKGFGNEHMNIYVVSATIDGVALEAGDTIAVFDGNVCSGLVRVDKEIIVSDFSTFASIMASKADDGKTNGYTSGNAITFKFWDNSKKMVVSGITAEFFLSNGDPTTTPTFTPNVTALVKLSGTTPVNQKPVSNAGGDQTVNEGVEVTLDGSASSDADSDLLTYKWTAPAGITLSSTTAEKPTFTAPEVAADTDYTFSLVVNDGTEDSAPDQVKITVKQVNKAPAANAGGDQTVNEGIEVTLDGSASSDADSDLLTYKWTVPAGITLSSETAEKPTFTAPDVSINTDYTFSLIVNDGTVDSPADEVKITVKFVNQAPVASATATPSTLVLNPGQTKTTQLDGSSSVDADGTIVSFSWSLSSGPVGGAAINSPNNNTTLASFSAIGSYVFKLTVTDDKGASDFTTVTVSVIEATNTPPVASATATPSTLVLNPGQTKTTQLDGSSSVDSDGTIVSFSWSLSSGPVGGAAINSPNNNTTLASFSEAGSYVLKLTVTDDKGASDFTTVTVSVSEATNTPPVASATATPSTLVLNPGQTKTTQLDGSSSVDADGTIVSFSWSLSSGPVGGAVINSPNNETTLASFSEAGSYVLKLTVTDDKGASDFTTVTVSVSEATNTPPVASAGSDQTVNEGSLVTLDGSASSDLEGSTLTYLWTAPTGILLSSATAANPTFTAPTVLADTEILFKLVVNDGTSNSIADEVIITVKNVNTLPVANAGSDQTVNEGDLVILNGSESNDPDESMEFNWTTPGNVEINQPITIKVLVSGPSYTSTTNHDFTLSLYDGSPAATPGNNSFKFNWTVPAGVTFSSSTVSVISIIPPDNITQSNYTFALKVSDGSDATDPTHNGMTYFTIAPTGFTMSPTTVVELSVDAPEPTTLTSQNFSMEIGVGTPAPGVIFMSNHWTIPSGITLGKSLKSYLTILSPDGVTRTDYDFSLLILNGSTSPSGITYKWTAPPGITLSSTTVRNPTFFAPEVNTDTEFKFQLVVNDGVDDSAPDEVIVKVLQVNKAPVANAGNNQTVNENTTVTLNGSGSNDPDGDALTYQWTAPSGIVLSSHTDESPTFMAPEVSTDTQFSFSLVVNDGKVDSPADQVLVTVKQVNKAPVANAGTNQSVNEGETVTLDGSGSTDPDGTTLSYQWTAPSGIILSSETVDKPTFTAPEVSTDTEFTFTLTVSDGILDSSAEVKVIILQVNKAPATNAGTNQSVNEGALVMLDGSASSDPDGDALTYQWTAPSGITLNSDTDAQPTFTAPEVAADTDFTISLLVSDGTLDSSADVTITVKQVNKAPVANAGTDQEVGKNETVMLDGSGSSDADNDVLTYQWTAPTGITLSSDTDAKPTFTSPVVTTDTELIFTLVVNDGTENSMPDQVIVKVTHVNETPVANAGNDQTVEENSTVSLDGSGSTDPEGNTLSYKWTAPAGIFLSSETEAKPTFTAPHVNANTDYTFTLVVSDGTTESLPDEVMIKVLNVDRAPYVKNPIPDLSVDKRAPDQIIDLATVFADDDSSDILTFSISSNTNDMVVLASISGSDLTLNFTDENVGNSEIEITASSNGKEVKSKFKVQVNIPTGIDLMDETSEIRIYPNPTTDIVWLKFSKLPDEGTWITMYGVSGKIIHKSLAKEKEVKLNLLGNPAGLYLLKVDQKTPKLYKIVLSSRK